jgi:diguanylate cyclase (GGDEF)-like protein/PAS domain S-box-containing protein
MLSTAFEYGQQRPTLSCPPVVKGSGITGRSESDTSSPYPHSSELQGIDQPSQQAETALKAIATRNQLLADSAPLGILIIDCKGRITFMNSKVRNISPWLSLQETISAYGADNQERVPADIFADIQQCIIQQKPRIVEHSYTDQQGARIHLRYSLSPIPGTDGTEAEVMAFVEDCTDLKRAELALKESEQKYRRLYHSAPIAMVEWDVTLLNVYLENLRADGISDFSEYLEKNPSEIYSCWSLIKTINYNLAFSDLMELERCATPADNFLDTDSDVFREMAREIILTIAQRNMVNQRELAVVTARGQTKYVLGKSMAISGSEENLDKVVVAMVDISHRRKAEEALSESEQRFKEQSLRDNLTRLYNQRYLYQSLAALIESAKSNDTPISLIFMDLDHFKRVVDTHGHLNGSRAIREVALTIDSCLQEPAYAVAYAGDEFVVVLPGYDQSQAFHKASEIRARMNDTVYVLERAVMVRLEASFGIATFPEDAGDLNDLIAAADQALFGVKGAGKNDIGRYQNKSAASLLELQA